MKNVWGEREGEGAKRDGAEKARKGKGLGRCEGSMMIGASAAASKKEGRKERVERRLQEAEGAPLCAGE